MCAGRLHHLSMFTDSSYPMRAYSNPILIARLNKGI
jgi:hypothetical protein